MTPSAILTLPTDYQYRALEGKAQWEKYVFVRDQNTYFCGGINT